MFKTLLALTLCLAIVSATDGPFAQLMEAFNQQLNIDTDTDFNACAEIPLIPDVNKTFHDLNTTNPNPVALAADVVAIYGDFENIKTDCPEVAGVYDSFFGKFIAAMKATPVDTVKQVVVNVGLNISAIQAAAVNGLQSFGAQNYSGAGKDLGIIVGLALKTWL